MTVTPFNLRLKIIATEVFDVNNYIYYYLVLYINKIPTD